MADLGEGPVGPGLPLIVRPPPPPFPYLKVCIRRWGGCYHIKLGRLKTLHWLKICMINSSDQKKATVADPDLQIRGLGGGRGGGMRSSIPEIREGPGLPNIYSQFTVNSALRASLALYHLISNAPWWNNRYNQTQPTFEIYILQMAVVTHNAICFPTNVCKSIVFNFQK